MSMARSGSCTSWHCSFLCAKTGSICDALPCITYCSEGVTNNDAVRARASSPAPCCDSYIFACMLRNISRVCQPGHMAANPKDKEEGAH